MDIDRVDSVDVVRVETILEFHIDINDLNPIMMLDLMFRTKVSFVRLLYNINIYIDKHFFYKKIFEFYLKCFRFKQYLHSNKIEKTMRRPPTIPVISTMNARLFQLKCAFVL